MFRSILIANRGEIAVRIIRACRNMGIKSIAVYSKEDKDSLHVQLADRRVCIGEGPAKNSYLNMERIISAAKNTDADAIHPGFGFLSENADFVRLCKENGIAFIGPSAEVIDSMGNKSNARKTMMEAGVPVVPGTKEPVYDAATGEKLADEIGYPVMIKASSGGGGKGMRVSRSKEDFEFNFNTAQRESANAFGDDTMYIEKFIENPRHVEIQIMADGHGNVVALGERDCSVQRNHQKLIEESPSPAITEKIRKSMNHDAILAAKAVGYTNAGTIEFILDPKGTYYFMEMNTRIQVEHGVTEMVTGTDPSGYGDGIKFYTGRCGDQRTCDRMSYQCRDSREKLYAKSRCDQTFAFASWKWSSCRYRNLYRVLYSIRIRFYDRESYRTRTRP